MATLDIRSRSRNDGPEPFDLESCIRIPEKPEGSGGPPAFLLLEKRQQPGAPADLPEHVQTAKATRCG